MRPLDEYDRKVLGGLVTFMIAEPSKIRDREWLAERFVQLAVVARGFDADAPHATTDDVAMVERHAKARMRTITNAALALFVRTADELRAIGGTPTPAAAQAIVAAYLGGR